MTPNRAIFGPHIGIAGIRNKTYELLKQNVDHKSSQKRTYKKIDGIISRCPC
jgi:hypothetical protein